MSPRYGNSMFAAQSVQSRFGKRGIHSRGSDAVASSVLVQSRRGMIDRCGFVIGVHACSVWVLVSEG